jgi:hypothetical protein
VIVVCHNLRTGESNRFGTDRGLAYARKRSEFLYGFIGYIGGMY